MARIIAFHPAAMHELQASYLWYHQQNPHAAHAFWDEIERAIENITEAPACYPAYMLTTRRYLLLRFPYFIVFRDSPDAIQVIAVAHGRRKPGYWRKRTI